MVQKGLGLVAILIFFGLGLVIYMDAFTSANTTGWNNLIVQFGGNYLPLIGIAAIMVLILTLAVSRGRNG